MSHVSKTIDSSHTTRADLPLLTELPEAFVTQPTPGSGRTLVIIPRAEFSFDDFVRRTPPRSVALDGFVTDPSKIDLHSHHFNFNHHAGCIRDITLCTAQQVHGYISDGLLTRLQVHDSHDYSVFLNDPDPDSATASFQMMFPHECRSSDILYKRMLNGFVGPLDVSAGVKGPELTSDLMREGAWIFEPYFRELPRIYSMDGKAISDLLGEMYGRMKDYLLGKGKKGEIAGSIQELARGAKWMMIKEHGAHSRLRTFQENLPLQGLIVFKGGVDDTYRYSAVRRNQLSIFPIELLSTCLNQAERLIEQGGLKAFNDLLSKKNGQATALWQELAAVKPPQEWVKPWGGGDAVIGCLRQKGSLIPPASMDPFMSKFMEDLAERAYQLNCHSLKDPLVPDA